MMAVQLLGHLLLSLLKWLTTVAVAIGFLAALGLGFFNMAFPKQRFGDFEHLVIPDSVVGCYSCHAKMTPKLAHDWYESRHRVEMVECFDCHGQPDGTGDLPFAANPDQRAVCGECHEPAIQHAEARFGLQLDCGGCHPFHQNALHRAAGEGPESGRKND
jgi:hypothetical protein